MTEIELKARVPDRAGLAARLDEIATYKGRVVRDDCYWQAPQGTGHGGRTPRLRLRRERRTGGADGEGESFFLTYKRKERRTDGTGTTIEVNDERECSLSAREPIEAFLADAGCTVALTKHKDVMVWKPAPDATFELCSVPPLGDFLEIEILAPADDPATVRAARGRLEGLLAQAGIPAGLVEERYYSELLATHGRNAEDV